MVPSGSMRLLTERCTQLWRLASRAPVVAAVLSLALVLAQLTVHQDEGSWVAKGALYDTAQLEGHFVEWEWIHVGQTVSLVDGTSRLPESISSQNMYRFAGPWLIAILRRPLPGLYPAAVGAAVLVWLGATWAIYALGRLAAGTPAAMAGAVLVSSGAGFIAFLGNVDAHPYGYAAVAIWLAVVECLGALTTHEPVAVAWPKVLFAGLLLCAAGYAMEIALPLLVFAWGFYGCAGIWKRHLATTLARLALMTTAFLMPYLGFRLLVERLLALHVVPFNEPLGYVRQHLHTIHYAGLGIWSTGQLANLSNRWLAAFPPVVSLLAVVGAGVMPPRWRLWAATLLGVFVVALMLSKPLVRDLYLAYPAVYLLAAAGAGRIAQAVAGWCAPAGNPITRARIRYVVLGALVTLVVVTVNADLWGNYSLPVLWFRVQ